MKPQQSLLITGGTGSFGEKMLRHLIKLPKNKCPGRIVILSRDEEKQYSQRCNFPDDRIEYIIGDVRDSKTCREAMEGIDIVIHAAALKQVPTGEKFPLEIVKTNVLGTNNLVEAAEMHGVKKFIILSTDKAVYPINAYGMSKALAEKIIIAASGKNFAKRRGTIYSVVRYGNIMGSRGSVIPLFIKQIKEKRDITVTDSNMTRFLLKINQAISLVLHVVESARQGRIYIKKSPACTIETLVKALELHYGLTIKKRYVGIRPGEKMHETLITAEENMRAEEEMDAFDNTPITTTRSYFECRIIQDVEVMTRYENTPLVGASDFTSQDAKLLNPEETLNLLKEMELL